MIQQLLSSGSPGWSKNILLMCAAGASDAEVVRHEGQPIECSVRYRFPDRHAFEVYERDHAPRLREEGLRKFPLELGLHYTRTVGTVVARFPPAQSPCPGDFSTGK